jgi:hypothetical protein
VSTRSRKTRNRKARRSTTQPKGQAPTPQQRLRLVLGGPHATPVRPITTPPRTTPAAPAQPPTDQYARLVDEVAEYAAIATLYAGAIGIHAPHAWWIGLSSSQAVCTLPDGVALVHTPGEGITAHRNCPGGQLHTAAIRSHPDHAPGDLHRFRIDTDICDQHTQPRYGTHVIPLHQRPKEQTP